MTTAVCIKCGELKFGALTPCPACGVSPRGRTDLLLSMALSDHYFDTPTLKQIGADIAAGLDVRVDEDLWRRLEAALEHLPAAARGLVPLVDVNSIE